jgi:vibriolysin
MKQKMFRAVLATAVSGVALFACSREDSQWRADAAPTETPGSQNKAEALAREVFASRPELRAGVDDVAMRAVHVDQLGQTHVRMAQLQGGVPVLGAEVIVHLAADGSLLSVTDDLVHDLRVAISPALAAAQAIQIAVATQPPAARSLSAPQAELVVLRRGKDHLTYRIQLDYTEAGRPFRPVLFIDAVTGAVVWTYDNLQTTQNRELHNLNHSTNLPGPLVRAEGAPVTGDVDVDTNYDWLGWVYRCYSELYDRDSFDNQGAAMISSVHYDYNYVNAFWNGIQMVYGDGDNFTSISLALSMDVTSHELTHAVTERSSGLIYAGESGGLNEAMSDIFGNVCEWYRDNDGNPEGPANANTWMVGEDVWLAAPALRYMNDPAADGISLDYYSYDAGNYDVHYSSGIANLAFHLLAAGGFHPRGRSDIEVTGIGVEAAGEIFYRINTVYLTPSSSFADARAASVQAAIDLFGDNSAQVAQTENAWAAVGVMEPPDYHVIETFEDLMSSSSLTYSFAIEGAAAVKFQLSGGYGDADLYVRRGSAPTTEIFDCRSAGPVNDETCEFNPAEDGTYHVLIFAYQPFGGMTFTVSIADREVPWQELSRADFETSASPYRMGGWDAYRYRSPFYAATGTYSARLRDDTGEAAAFTTAEAMDLSGRTTLRIAYSMRASGMEPGENYLVELQANGGSWQVLRDFVSGTDFVNTVRKTEEIEVELVETTAVKLRFRCDASADDDRVFIDDVVVSAR